jgi:hypothetical protein
VLNLKKKKKVEPGTRGSCLVILGILEAEIRRIAVQSHPRQVQGDPISKNPSQK